MLLHVKTDLSLITLINFSYMQGQKSAFKKWEHPNFINVHTTYNFFTYIDQLERKHCARYLLLQAMCDSQTCT